MAPTDISRTLYTAILYEDINDFESDEDVESEEDYSFEQSTETENIEQTIFTETPKSRFSDGNFEVNRERIRRRLFEFEEEDEGEVNSDD